MLPTNFILKMFVLLILATELVSCEAFFFSSVAGNLWSNGPGVQTSIFLFFFGSTRSFGAPLCLVKASSYHVFPQTAYFLHLRQHAECGTICADFHKPFFLQLISFFWCWHLLPRISTVHKPDHNFVQILSLYTCRSGTGWKKKTVREHQQQTDKLIKDMSWCSAAVRAGSIDQHRVTRYHGDIVLQGHTQLCIMYDHVSSNMIMTWMCGFC